MSNKIKKIEDTFFIGSHGKVQIQIHNSVEPTPKIAVVFPNDPLQYMGHMDNPVVKLIANQFIEQNFTVIKMNYRGIGKSDSRFEGGDKELENATFLIDWILNTWNRRELWACGFSYGAWVAMQIMMRRPEINNFLVAAPPCNKYDFSFLSPCPVSGLIVHGTADSITPVSALKELTGKSSTKHKRHNIKVKYIEHADHFFRNRENDLSSAISDYIKEHTRDANSIKERNKDFDTAKERAKASNFSKTLNL